MGAMSGDVAAGNQTARLSIDEQAALHRAETAASATAYLTRTGNADVLPILGLAAAPEPEHPRSGTTRKVRIRKSPPSGGAADQDRRRTGHAHNRPAPAGPDNPQEQE